MLPQMKRPPTLKAFVGEAPDDKVKPVQSGGDLVCIMDQWRFATVTMATPRPTHGPRKKPKPPQSQE